ncbi:tRNA (adenosine(37)-N6)-threonylcarbamoyltransferase complex dimerization subunit type 1 TsaB [Aureibacter tunicatorum]|uniref:tRNA threonylcarbamoyladenosine biosynthesis protein TsaB n=1 Tax=Aureibacter tunicatorum TaxID=866807 RepID=A0AAE3XJT9_9BACT|nr:tRNA (adenosine(37)-N6)-threonylcarbamoyltransferase complex dimerization subunit type 1 TsaB [Aureibacter tunicatorum]MDR6237785.1 tRNA threonylcarbamoyladenosine biosynthesis protein TsaB [Aureibacter tunicatorum]BDD02820.1 tRNA (adenosine(37)-N6)-threonylcarbamoyltransferase complex dimerization subunit type 1 TsaB [Aureibacter tunicatorum]
MGLILSIESATNICSVALHREGQLLGREELFAEKSHSGMMTTVMGNVVTNCGFQLGDLSAVAVSEGPGSYTGLRIGTSSAKGLCYALNLPLIAVNTLHAMAKDVSSYILDESAILRPMLDARRMEVYTLSCDSNAETVIGDTKPVVVDESSFENDLSKAKVYFFGNGAEKCKPLFGEHENAFFIPDVNTSAHGVGLLAWEKFMKQEFVDLAYFEPFYLKEFHFTTPKKKLL